MDFFISLPLSFSPVTARARPGACARRAHGERTRQRRTSTSTRASERGGRRASAHRHANAQRGRADAAGKHGAAPASGHGGRPWRSSDKRTRRASECGSGARTASSLGGALSEAKAEASSLGAGGYLKRPRPVAVAAMNL